MQHELDVHRGAEFIERAGARDDFVARRQFQRRRGLLRDLLHTVEKAYQFAVRDGTAPIDQLQRNRQLAVTPGVVDIELSPATPRIVPGQPVDWLAQFGRPCLLHGLHGRCRNRIGRDQTQHAIHHRIGAFVGQQRCTLLLRQWQAGGRLASVGFAKRLRQSIGGFAKVRLLPFYLFPRFSRRVGSGGLISLQQRITLPALENSVGCLAVLAILPDVVAPDQGHPNRTSPDQSDLQFADCHVQATF
jgi:hypothetical protein